MTTPHAVVAGGSRGLGLVIVQRFLARQCNVTVLSRRPSDHHAGSKNIQHLAIDLATDDLSDIGAKASEKFGPIQYLVLCQRFRGEGDPWQGEIQVGLNASRALIESCLDHFSKDGDKAVGAVSSVYAEFVGGSQPVSYHVVKAGLNAMVRFYAWSLGPRGIRVNAVMPLSYIKDESRPFYSENAELKALYRKLIPVGRMGEAADTANAIDFLCSEKAAFISGQSIFVDGGASIVWPEEVAKSFSGL
jgi:NAD(P)-dependent dehydrogenase (short-subunit alcohol dehydrogenase family)